MKIPQDVRDLIETGPLAHVFTLNADGSPQVSAVWIGIDGEEIVMGHTADHRKLKNMRHDSRVAISMEYPERHSRLGLQQYVVLYGEACIEEGGAKELINRLTKVYMGPNVEPSNDIPTGYVTRITVQRIAGLRPDSSVDDKYGISGDKK